MLPFEFLTGTQGEDHNNGVDNRVCLLHFLSLWNMIVHRAHGLDMVKTVADIAVGHATGCKYSRKAPQGKES